MTTANETTLFQQSMQLHQQGNLADAEKGYLQTLLQEPAHYDALHMMGVVCLQRSEWTQAQSFFLRARAVHAEQATLHFHLGLAAYGLEAHAEALDAFNQALLLEPTMIEAKVRRAEVATLLGAYEQARSDYEEILRIHPDVAVLWLHKGDLFCLMRDYQQAIAAYDQSLKLEYSVKAIINKGNAYENMGSSKQAFECYRQAEGQAEAYKVELLYNQANCLKTLKRFAEAQKLLDQLLVLDPDYAKAWHVQGLIFKEQKRFSESLEAFRRAMSYGLDIDYLAGEKAAAEMRLCNWDQWYDLPALLPQHAHTFSPFLALSLTDDPLQQRAISTSYTEHLYPVPMGVEKPAHAPDLQHRRIRIGYFSADLRYHALTFLMAGVLEAHDRSLFEIHAYSYGIVSRDDPMHKKIKEGIEHVHDVYNWTDDDILNLARSHQLDIAFDLTGTTAQGRPALFARRLAPVQINYLGYPGTSGASFMDYMITDRVTVPEANADGISEQQIVMPYCFQANDDKRLIGPMQRREIYGIKEDAFVFACFNNSYKINPDIFDDWMKILKGSPSHAILWLIGERPEQTERLCHEAIKRGIDSERLIFAPYIEYSAHLARYAQVDLVLDTLPFNGGTTTSDALWGGAPVLTCMGQSFSGRMAASLLTACGMTSLICEDRASYIQKAIGFSNTPGGTRIYKKHLALHKRNMPLFQTTLFTRHLEQGLRAAVEISAQGGMPRQIVVENPEEIALPSV